MDEDEYRALHAAGRYDELADTLLRQFAPQLFGFLRAQVGSVADAEEAYSMFAVDLWRGLPNFRQQCTFRAWVYTLGRNAARRYLARQLRPRRAELPLSAADELPAQIRSSTARFIRTEVKDRFAELRAHLSEEEQLLLVLRIDKQMDFLEIAAVFCDASEDVDAETLAREAARLRQRLQQLKSKLRGLAAAAGLLDGNDG